MNKEKKKAYAMMIWYYDGSVCSLNVAVFVCFPVTSLQRLTHGTQITSPHNTHYVVAYFSEFSCITSRRKLQPSSIPK